MADLAGDPARPSEDTASDDEARADAGGETHIGHHVDTRAGAEHRLAKGTHVCVVVEVDRNPQTLPHLGGGIQPHPRGQDRL